LFIWIAFLARVQWLRLTVILASEQRERPLTNYKLFLDLRAD
jgi:hypothetical protein